MNRFVLSGMGIENANVQFGNNSNNMFVEFGDSTSSFCASFDFLWIDDSGLVSFENSCKLR